MFVRNGEKFVIKIFHFTPLRDRNLFAYYDDVLDDSGCFPHAFHSLDVTSMRKLKIVGITKDHKIS